MPSPGGMSPTRTIHDTTCPHVRSLSGVLVCLQWPGVQTGVQPTNSALRLFGGAAFERCIEEFQEAVKALDFPTVAKDRVANLLLAQRSRGQATGAVAAAEDIARATARKMLAPLLETACARLAAVMRKVFEIAADQMASGAGEIDDTLAPYVAFHAALRASYNAFVNKLEERAKVPPSGSSHFPSAVCRLSPTGLCVDYKMVLLLQGLVSHHLEAATSEWSIGLLSLNESWSHGDNSENTVPVMREKDTTETVDEVGERHACRMFTVVFVVVLFLKVANVLLPAAAGAPPREPAHHSRDTIPRTGWLTA